MSHIITINLSLKISDKQAVLQALTKMGIKVSAEHKVSDYYGKVTTVKDGVITFNIKDRWFTLDKNGNLIGDTYGLGELPINTIKFAVLLAATMKNGGRVKRVEMIGDGWTADVEDTSEEKFAA
jgi:hypothetical protein